MENIFADHKLVLYFLAMLYILISKESNEKQKIIIVYIFSYIVAVTQTINLLPLFIILNIALFIYFEIVSEDTFKNQILSKLTYKLLDYIYKLFFEYYIVSFFISILVISGSFSNIFVDKINELYVLSFNFFMLSVSITFIIYSIINISMENYATYSFTEIMDKMVKIKKWSDLRVTENSMRKFKMLCDIEDKSYFERKKSYSSFSFEYVKLFFRRKKAKKEQYTPCKTFKQFKRRYLRGYSTIEMQLIRTLGIKIGYEKVLRRKIYEIIYSKIFFKSLAAYYKKYRYEIHNCTLKEYLIYIYIHVAKIKIKNIQYKNMLDIWKDNDIDKITDEKWFISIIGLAEKKINKEVKNIYRNFIDYYNIDIKEVLSLVDKLK